MKKKACSESVNYINDLIQNDARLFQTSPIIYSALMTRLDTECQNRSKYFREN